MANRVILGAQWGDEGKGKITDLLAESADLIARYQGGGNAGHTIVIDGETFVLHLLPSGILRPDKECLLGNGMVVELEGLFDEIDRLEERGIAIGERVKISSRTHLIMPYHRLIDSFVESTGELKKIGTTLRGIGPCYADKINRYSGIRVAELMNFDLFRKKVETNLATKDKLAEGLREQIDESDFFERYYGYAERLKPHVIEADDFLHSAIEAGKTLLFEGAQGTLLDVDFGTYPYVTSSNTTIGGVFTGLGVGPKAIDEILGVAKAYVTRVGEGPFPTEMPPEMDEKVRKLGGEFGATTERARRCGWLDLVALRYAVRINGITGLALTKLDVLDHLDELKVCTGYELGGKITTTFPSSSIEVAEVKPVYKIFPGWRKSTETIRSYEELPENAKKYVEYIAESLGVPIPIISVGPGRDQTIKVDF